MIDPGDSKRAFTVAPPAKPVEVGTAGFVADWINDQLDDLIGTYDKDVIVDTTIDPKIQAEAERALSEAIARRGTSVLILDQLDAIRWTARHSLNALEVCKSLVAEVGVLARFVRVFP